MIGYLEGIILYKEFPAVCLGTGGVGYEVTISARIFSEVGDPGDSAALFISTLMKENSMELYGFRELEERRLFHRMIQINGVGPKLAINILSQMTAAEFIEAVNLENARALCRLKGIGKKTAERIILELAGKLTRIEDNKSSGSGAGSLIKDLASALGNLGFSRKEVEATIKKLEHEDPAALGIEELISRALVILTRN